MKVVPGAQLVLADLSSYALCVFVKLETTLGTATKKVMKQ